jgi:type VI protein secretion system component Hcp
MSVELQDAMISSYSAGGRSGSSEPSETFSISFSGIKNTVKKPSEEMSGKPIYELNTSRSD